MKPAIGQPAPDFDLPSNLGYNISLESLKGKKIILYFYPKDNTPGCTKEACSFRDAFADLEELGVVVLGVSRDNTESHKRFAGRYGLPFTLLSDTSGEVSEKYGVLVEKSNFGIKLKGIERSTFLIDEEGKVKMIWEKVKPDKHINDIIGYLNKS